MPLNTIFTSGTNSEGGLETGAFIVIVLAISIGWLNISLLIRIIDNFAYKTLSMNPVSTIHSIIIFLSVFFLFILFVWFVDKLEIIPVSSATQNLQEATGGLIAGDVTDDNQQTASSTVQQQLGMGWRNGNLVVIGAG